MSQREETAFGLFGVATSGNRVCVYPGRAEKGEEPNMSPGQAWDTHDIIGTGVVCLYLPKAWERGRERESEIERDRERVGAGGGGRLLLTVGFEPVRPVGASSAPGRSPAVFILLQSLPEKTQTPPTRFQVRRPVRFLHVNE